MFTWNIIILFPVILSYFFLTISQRILRSEQIFKCGIETYHTLLPEGLNYTVGTMTKFW